MNKFKFIDEKQEQLKKIQEIIPWAFDDGLLNIKKIEKEFVDLGSIDLELNSERYGLYWYGKSLARNLANLESFRTLQPKKDESLNFDSSNNLIIAGDNLEVLKLLKLNYHNKVDVIYIDPPYNTGNDFVYKDNFIQTLEDYKIKNNLVDDDNNYLTTNQRTDGRFHSNWLDMIYPRILLSRQLLKDDGIICISIDDNEYHRLKIVCDEIYGENNYISTITWQKKSSGTSSDSKYMKSLNEYILVYSKNKNSLTLNKEKLNIDDGSYKYIDNYFERRGRYKLNPLDRGGLRWSKELDYELEIEGKIFYPGGVSKEEWIKRLSSHAQKDWQWRWSKKKVIWGLENGFIHVSNNKVYTKQYQLVDSDDVEIARETPFSNLIPNSEISSSLGTDELRKLFDDIKVFDHPKPISLIKYLLNLNKNKDALVLDFFAGSGSTGHAVMDLNNLDQGNRKYILVQIKELVNNNDDFYTIVDITKERIKRAIQKNNYKDNGFKYFEIAKSNFLDDFYYASTENKIESLKLSIELQSRTIKDNANELDLVYEVGIKNNIFTLDKNIEEHFDSDQKYYLVNNNDLSTLFFFHPLKNTQFYGDIYIYI